MQSSVVPAHVVGILDGSDVQSPTVCATIDAQYGVESAGPDSVVRIDGLVPGTAYIVQLTSGADLSFYIASGCSTVNGPSVAECALFVDATTGAQETGRFIANATSVYVIVDYYASASPSISTFILDVYPEACTSSAQCAAGSPVCSNGKCVECVSSFDCANAALPRCDVTSQQCVAGLDQCSTEDPSEPEDDGPIGARALALGGTGGASASGSICSQPASEADFFKFTVGSIGQTWDVTLAWSDNRQLRLSVWDAAGNELGRSYWEQPQRVRLTYLPLGTYYVRVSDATGDASAVAYTLSVQRTLGSGCTSRADCAAEYRNQIYRGDCQAGACVAINGGGVVTEGGACDSRSDCRPNLSCSSFLFVAGADTRDVCARYCSNDADCAPLGNDYVCSTYLAVSNFCVQKCTADAQCPTTTAAPAAGQPWDRLQCQLYSGRCL